MSTAGSIVGMIAEGRCEHCGCWHTGACPRVRSIEYHPDGSAAGEE